MPDDPDLRIVGGAPCEGCPRLTALLATLAALGPLRPTVAVITEAADDACIGCASSPSIMKIECVGEDRQIILELFPD